MNIKTKSASSAKRTSLKSESFDAMRNASALVHDRNRTRWHQFTSVAVRLTKLMRYIHEVQGDTRNSFTRILGNTLKAVVHLKRVRHLESSCIAFIQSIEPHAGLYRIKRSRNEINQNVDQLHQLSPTVWQRYSSVNFLSRARPASPLFSGWNCTPITLSWPITAVIFVFANV